MVVDLAWPPIVRCILRAAGRMSPPVQGRRATCPFASAWPVGQAVMMAAVRCD
jgi:hypothetical protein